MTLIRIKNRRSGAWWRWLPRILFLIGLLGGVGAVCAAVGAYVHFSRDLPDIVSVADYKPPTVSRFYADDGRLMGEFSVERRIVTPLARMPRHLIEAFLAAEDKRFFAHRGVDYRATIRAVLANYMAGRRVQGASTITQQLCKTLVGRERSYARKIREAILSRRTEHALTKLEILELYLNEIYLGHGAHGVQAAARNYYRKDVWELSLAEAAILAGLPPQPGALNPVIDFEGAKARQRYVLDRMVDENFIDRATADGAAAEELVVYSEKVTLFDDGAPYYTEHVRKQVQERYGYDALNTGGLQVHMAVDADFQRLGQRALQRGLHSMGERQGYTGIVATLDEAERPGFLSRARDLYDGPVELLSDVWYFGLVTAMDKKGADVLIGDRPARLPLKGGMRWAVPYDIEAEKNGKRLGKATDALSVGDVILVRKNRGKKFRDQEPPVLALGQIPPVQGALVSMESDTGYVVSMVGGFDFDQSEYNRAFQGCRQPGSVFKPIVYSLALDRDYTLATPLDDTPITVYDRKEQYLWKPKNFGGNYRGYVLLRNAFVKSMNIPAIRTIRHVGARDAADWATHLGVTTPMYPDQSLVLGSSCVYPWDMVKVYGTFAARGKRPRPVFIKRVEDRDGNILEDRTHFSDPWAPIAPRLDGMLRALFEPREAALSPATAYLVQTALGGVVNNGTATKARALKKPAGGKTGTTDAYDAWFLGFTDSLTTGVWVGSDRNRRKLGSRETGGKVALPIWLRYMTGALRDVPEPEFTADPPPGIEFADIDLESGLLAPAGNRSLHLPFRQGTQPLEAAPEAGSFDNQDLDLVEGRF